jgi:hypothetical protein
MTKKADLNLNMFLHSVTCLPIKDNNKQFALNLGNTNDIMFSLNDFLDFNQSITTLSHMFPFV